MDMAICLTLQDTNHIEVKGYSNSPPPKVCGDFIPVGSQYNNLGLVYAKHVVESN